MNENGLKGFYCPASGRREPFDFCWTKCVNHCKPLPVLLSLAGQTRGVEENIYHVTEILNPPQVVYLKRNNPYYLSPDSLVDMNVGTAWHEKLYETRKFVQELGLQDDYLMERNFKEYFSVAKDGKVTETFEPWSEDGLVTLSGTSDLYVKSTKTLWDYKVMKYYYTFKYLSEGNWEGNSIPLQLNIYRVYQYPEASAIKIFCYLKDFKLNMTDLYDINQTETLQVPMMPDEVVKKKVVDLLTEHVETQRTGKPRPCTKEERWFNKKGEPLRCMYYCAVNEICEQYAKEKK